MEQLDSHMFNAVTKLRNNKKQPTENSIYNYILKTVESLTAEQLENRLRDLIKANKLENKPHRGRNSYFIVESEGSNFPKETSPLSDIIFPEETLIPSPVLIDTHKSKFSKLKAEVDLIKKYIENLNAEIEAIKMFMKDQFRLLKNSNSEENICESAENTKVIELLQHQNQNLIQENASKNTIIKVLAEKHTFDKSNSKSTVSEDFTTVNNISGQKKIWAKET